MKLKKFQLVRKDMNGDRLERNVSRRDRRKEKDKLGGKEKDQWENQEKNKMI